MNPVINRTTWLCTYGAVPAPAIKRAVRHAERTEDLPGTERTLSLYYDADGEPLYATARVKSALTYYPLTTRDTDGVARAVRVDVARAEVDWSKVCDAPECQRFPNRCTHVLVTHDTALVDSFPEKGER